MNPFSIAHLAYHREPPGLQWEAMLDAHLRGPCSFVISSPGLFLAARLVNSTWPDARLLDPRDSAPDGDSFHVYVAAGRMQDMLALIPASLRPRIRYFTFQRRGFGVHRVRAARLLGS